MAAPFVFGRIAERTYFTDREVERARLVNNFLAQTNTIIISPRRWGKSSLVQQVSADLSVDHPELKICLIDLFNVRSEAEFYAHLARGVMKATASTWEEFGVVARRFLSHLRPAITISPEPSQEISFDVDWRQAQREPDEILDLAERIAQEKGLRLIVCVDEFQAIANFDAAEAFQRKLRSHWQRHQRVAYCLYGSKRHMLLDIFSNPEMPFYRFGDIIILEKIDNAVWGDFIQSRFAATGKRVSPELARQIARLADNHSYYVQQLAQQVWFRTDQECLPETVESALSDLVSQLGLLFTGLVESLTTRQVSFLRAVLDGERTLSSQEILKTYDLGTSANVIRIKDALVKREIIDVVEGRVELLDPVFGHWLQREYFAV